MVLRRGSIHESEFDVLQLWLLAAHLQVRNLRKVCNDSHRRRLIIQKKITVWFLGRNAFSCKPCHVRSESGIGRCRCRSTLLTVVATQRSVYHILHPCTHSLTRRVLHVRCAEYTGGLVDPHGEECVVSTAPKIPPS